MFTYYMPTKLYVGEDALLKNENALILGKRAMVVTGKSSGEKSGALSDVLSILKAKEIPYLVYDKIENNPTLEAMVAGGTAARKFGADFLIGIGGGSPLDAAKAIGVFCQNPPSETFAPEDVFTGVFAKKPLPMAAIPTTAGTGSEVTQYSILTVRSIENKKSFSTPEFYTAAFLDGRYTKNLPLQIARNTAADAMCHLLEGLTCRRATDGTDYIALEGLRVMGKALPSLLKGTLTDKDREHLLWASCLGGMVIAQTATTIVHSMGYPLTYHMDIPHGLANGLLLSEYMRRTEGVLPEKTKAALSALGMESVEALSSFLQAILPKPAGFTEAVLTGWTEKTILAKNVATCPFPVTREDEAQMYFASLL